MKSPIPYTYDLNTKSAQKVICVTHTDDNSVDVIQLHVVQNGALIDFSGNTIIARMVMSRTHELLSDNVVCEIDEVTKDIMIPIDRKAVSTRKGLMLVEVSVRGVLPQKLTFQFPLLVRVNGSILDDAEITPESQGTIPELLKDAADALEEATQALEQAGDYDSLEHKPQINSHTLSGNKSSDDLGLQKKLTAGTNITIANDGTISASGGVTSYNDLTDKPQINDIALDGNKSASDLGLQGIINNYFTVENNEYFGYDFNSISLLNSNSVMYCAPFSRVRNFPNSLSDKIRQSGTLYIFHYVHTVIGAKYLIRRIMGWSPSGNYAEFAQYCTVVDGSSSIIRQSDWIELSGGGSQIVSGVVNQNGTITFTDSEGQTVTTAGNNIVTSGNQQISTGYDSGGFYFLFDDGQEAS